MISRHVRPGDVVCDIGANKGGFMYWLSCWVRGGRVRAAAGIGPRPGRRLPGDRASQCAGRGQGGLFAFGRTGFVSPGRPSTRCVPSSNRAGDGALHDPIGAAGRARRLFRRKRQCHAAQDRCGRRRTRSPEGRGTDSAATFPAPVFECENRHLAPGSVQDVFSYLAGLGYEGSFVRSNRLFPIAKFDAAIHQRQDGEWFWKSKDYCNNFVFAKTRRGESKAR